MKEVANNLHDPSWWFTAVIIGILASVIAGFLKDYLERKFGVFFAWTASKREKLKNDRHQKLDAWSGDANVLAIALLRMIYSSVLFMGMATLVAIYITYLRLRYNVEAFGKMNLTLHQIASLIFGNLALMWMAFNTVLRISLVQDCYRFFRDKNNLPRIFFDDNEV